MKNLDEKKVSIVGTVTINNPLEFLINSGYTEDDIKHMGRQDAMRIIRHNVNVNLASITVDFDVNYSEIID